jgi:hypothetical protein
MSVALAALASTSASWAYEYQVGLAHTVVSPCAPGVGGIACTLPGGGTRISVQNSLKTTGGAADTITGVANTLGAGTPNDLMASALAISDSSGRTVVLIGVDVLGFDPDLVEDVRARLHFGYGLAPEDVLLNASHTHTAPTMRYLSGVEYMGFDPEGTPDPQYRELLVQRIVATAGAALSSTSPADLIMHTGHSAVAEYRRQDGEPAPLDQPLDVLEIRREGTVGLVVAFGCHPTTRWSHGSILSADFPGVLRDELATRFSIADVMFLQGLAGDRQSWVLTEPHAPPDQRERDTGVAVADDVESLVQDPLAPAYLLTGPVSAATRVVRLPLSRSAPWPHNAKTHLPTEMQTIVFGAGGPSPWTLVATSGEVVSELQSAFHAKVGTRATLLGYSNGVESYVPTRRMMDIDQAVAWHWYPDPGGPGGAYYEGNFSFRLYGWAPPQWEDSDLVSGLDRRGARTADDFQNGVRDSWRWMREIISRANGHNLYDPQVLVAETASKLEITPRANVGGLHYGGYASIESYDLTEARATVHVAQIPSGTAEALFSIGPDGDTLYRYLVQGGILWAEKRVSGSTQPLNWVAYNQSATSWLRIRNRESDHRIVWEYGGDGHLWWELWSAAPDAAIDLSNARVELAGGTWTSVSNPGVVKFDTLHVEPDATVEVASRLADTFLGSTIDPARWSLGTLSAIHAGTDPWVTHPTWDPAVQATQNGLLTISPLASTAGYHYGGYVTNGVYDVRNRSVTVRLVHGPTGTRTEGLFSVGPDPHHMYRISVQATRLYCDVVASGSDIYASSTPYDQDGHRYLRIRHDEGTGLVHFEAWPGAGPWTPVCSPVAASPDITLSAVRVELAGGTWASASAPGTVQFDDVVLQ